MLYETKLFVQLFICVVCAFAKRNKLSKLWIKKGYHQFQCVVAGAAITLDQKSERWGFDLLWQNSVLPKPLGVQKEGGGGGHLNNRKNMLWSNCQVNV